MWHSYLNFYLQLLGKNPETTTELLALRWIVNTLYYWSSIYWFSSPTENLWNLSSRSQFQQYFFETCSCRLIELVPVSCLVDGQLNILESRMISSLIALPCNTKIKQVSIMCLLHFFILFCCHLGGSFSNLMLFRSLTFCKCPLVIAKHHFNCLCIPVGAN